MNIRPQMPLKVFFDGQCPLCRREIAYYHRIDSAQHLQCIDIMGPDFVAQRYGLDTARVHAVMHAQDAAGQVYTELDAFEAIWAALPPSLGRRLLRRLLNIRPIRAMASVAYRLFARNRWRLTGRCAPDGACQRN
ncbi:MAG: DUF393 domain-containing protein [Phycisphaerales bacterium]|nr:DUF393 domain-containing protein [Phycisphaerales bacterium]